MNLFKKMTIMFISLSFVFMAQAGDKRGKEKAAELKRQLYNRELQSSNSAESNVVSPSEFKDFLRKQSMHKSPKSKLLQEALRQIAEQNYDLVTKTFDQAFYDRSFNDWTESKRSFKKMKKYEQMQWEDTFLILLYGEENQRLNELFGTNLPKK